MESFAKLSLVILWYIWLLIQFFSSMCKGAAIFKDAFAGQLPIFAQFSLVLCPEILVLGLLLSMVLEIRGLFKEIEFSFTALCSFRFSISKSINLCSILLAKSVIEWCWNVVIPNYIIQLLLLIQRLSQVLKLNLCSSINFWCEFFLYCLIIFEILINLMSLRVRCFDRGYELFKIREQACQVCFLFQFIR